MDIIDSRIQEYAERFSGELDPLQQQLLEYTLASHPEHHMISGRLQGKLLEMVSRMIRPSRILEIGTFTGFSALCLVKGLNEDGELHTIELREDDAATARIFFDQSDWSQQIHLHVGDAKQVIPALKQEWDLVFLDADKTGYIEYFNLVLPNLKKNGFILADNILFRGQVIDSEPKGKNAKAISSFNNYLQQRGDIDKLVLTIRDGLFLIRKL